MAPFARTAQRFGAHARLVDPRGGRGTKIKSNKVTAEIPTTTMPLPTHVVLPMQQHIGAQCKPTVKRRDHVDVGTLVGHADARTTADIFSPVSGTVKELHKFYYTNGRNDVAVVIEPASSRRASTPTRTCSTPSSAAASWAWEARASPRTSRWTWTSPPLTPGS